MRKLKNKVKTNFGRKLTRAAIIAAAGLGAMSVTVPAFADEMHHCTCGENHDDPNCKCGCQEAKALVADTLKELESSQLTLKEKRELQEQLQAELEAVKKAHEEYLEELQNAIDENMKKAQEAYDEAKSILDSANATSNEAQEALEAAAAEYEAAANALKEAEEALAALEEANPGIEKEYEDDLEALQTAQDELDQAIEDEEKALAEKEEADRQAEEARQRRENARAAWEKAKEDADAAQKKKAEAEDAKRAADAAQTEAQDKYNEADEAYSYKKGLADGTIPIESTPEWEEAQKTQEALDKATADKEKADEELKKAEDDLAEKEKALDDANANYDEKSKVCEETREALKKAKEELAAAQEENKADKEALENAKTEKENADKDVEDKTKELDEADKALEDAKKAQEDAQKALEDAEKAKKEAEEALQNYKDEKRNSYAFCNWIIELLSHGVYDSGLDIPYQLSGYIGTKGPRGWVKSSYGCAIIDDAENAVSRFDYLNNDDKSKVKGSSDLTDEKDATNIDNTYEAIKFLRECNELRKREGLSEFRVSLTLMMTAQAQLNWSDNNLDHSNASNVGENLAWGQKNTADLEEDLVGFSIDESNRRGRATGGPYSAWYSLEKYFKENPELKEKVDNYQTGHYDNIIRPYTITGFAYNTDSEKYRTAFGQTFSSEELVKEEEGDDVYEAHSYYRFLTVDDFESLLTGYMSEIQTEQDKLEKALEEAENALTNAKTENENAKQNVTDKTQAKSDAEDALEQAEQDLADKTKALENAVKKEETSAKRVSDAETALGMRTEDNEQAEEELTQAEEVKTEAEQEAKAAAEVKDEKQQEADKKTETFTEAKQQDDAADQVVQDLLDGKEVPALKAVADEAKEELDNANSKQTEAENNLKAAEDDSKAKSDDLNKKTAEEEDAVKDQEAKEKAAKDKEAALNTAKDNKKAAEDKKAAADAKAADSKKRLDDVNAARDAKDAAKKKSDDAQSKKDAAQKKADDAASHVSTVSTEADLAKQVLDEAKTMNAESAITSSEEECYAPFADKINKVKAAIKDEDEANVRYTKAENECVTAEADEKTKKEAYDQAVTSYSTVHEHCGHDMMEISYSCTAGNGNVWTKTSGKTSDFTFERSHEDDSAFTHFTGISVDGKALKASDYTAEAGSVNVKLSAEFLETLAVGEHIIKAEFDDGSAEAKFTVRAEAGSGKVVDPQNTAPVQRAAAAVTSSPQVAAASPAVTQTANVAPVTGDNGAGIWAIAASISAAAAAGVVIYRKRKADR